MAEATAEDAVSIMNYRVDQLFHGIDEQIVVLRAKPGGQQPAPGSFTIGSKNYLHNAYWIIIDKEENQRAVIQRKRISFDGSNVPISLVDYTGVLIPPLSILKVDDILIRLDHNHEELYIEGITVTAGVQDIDLINRSRARGPIG